MSLLEKYRINRFRTMLTLLNNSELETEILNVISYIDQNGTTKIEGSRWIGFSNNGNLQNVFFTVTSNSREKEFKIRNHNREVVLNLCHSEGYFYRQIEEKEYLEKELSDHSVVKTVITKKDKKVFQDGIEWGNSQETIKDCILVANDEETPLLGECNSKSIIALRTVEGDILTEETEKIDGKEIRSAKILRQVSFIQENIAALKSEEAICIDIDLFDAYLQGNISSSAILRLNNVLEKTKK